MAISAPTDVTVSGQDSGSEVANPVTFSAIFHDDTYDCEKVQIQVNDDVGFSGRMLWDSGWVDITTISEGDRSEEIQYNGYKMTPYEVYYIRMRFQNTNSDISDWSAVT